MFDPANLLSVFGGHKPSAEHRERCASGALLGRARSLEQFDGLLEKMGFDPNAHD